MTTLSSFLLGKGSLNINPLFIKSLITCIIKSRRSQILKQKLKVTNEKFKLLKKYLDL